MSDEIDMSKWTCFCHTGVKKSLEYIQKGFSILIVVLLAVLSGLFYFNWEQYKTVIEIKSDVTIIKHDINNLERLINNSNKEEY